MPPSTVLLARLTTRSLRSVATARPTATATPKTTRTATPTATPTSKLLVPAYFYPDVWNTPNQWFTMCDNAPSQSIVIMNPNSGPGTSSNSDYVTAVGHCQNNNINVIGYVYTSYGSRALSAVEADIDKYYNWYGVNGIFLDQMSSNARTLSYYQTLFNYIRTKGDSLHDLNVGNMGTAPTTDWPLHHGIVDVLNIFEGSASSFSSFSMPSWASNYVPSSFSIIVYGVSSSSLRSICSTIANIDHVTYRYVTDGTLPNPYGSLPSYWNTEASSG